MNEKAITCTECYKVLTEIKTEVASTTNLYKEMFKINARNNTKIMIGMLGIIGATLGKEIIGTPWYVDIAHYSSILAAIFVVGITIKYWKKIPWDRITLRFLFCAMLFLSVGARTFIFQAGVDTAPEWFSAFMDVFYIAIPVFMIIVTGKNDRHAGNP